MTQAGEEPICEVFDAIIVLGIALGVVRICDLPGAWIHKVDDHWTFAVNGRDETLEVQPDADTMKCTVPFGHAAVWYNGGWLAGIITPYGGEFVVGAGANEDTFITALENAKKLCLTDQTKSAGAETGEPASSTE